MCQLTMCQSSGLGVWVWLYRRAFTDMGIALYRRVGVQLVACREGIKCKSTDETMGIEYGMYLLGLVVRTRRTSS